MPATGMLRSVPSILVAACIGAAPALAQTTPLDSSYLSVTRIYGSAEFRPESFGPARWLAGGMAYTTLEPSVETKGGQDIVRYEAETGARSILVPAARLVPSGASAPLAIEDYSWSDNGRQLLVFTNSKPVWRTNTRGDYWALSLDSWTLKKLGGDAAPSTLMFAKFAPDGRRVGYVRDFNLYVEDLASGALTKLTQDGSRVTINGTFDWVYEEELGLQDGWRWSPDGKNIAFWQLVADSVRNFALINYTDSLYPVVTEVQYPKAGESNSAARIGVVSAAGGNARWLDLPGDPRNYYAARMEWAANSEQVVVQQLNRLQNADVLFLGERTTGAVHPILTERDSAWVDVVRDFKWLDGGKSFLWTSERDGWKHVYVVSRDGQTVRLITPGKFDVADVTGVDEKSGYV
ncbi:MAG: DPP IV N-terminal domain-containing protein, partial [Gemmatimonadota bacterium]